VFFSDTHESDIDLEALVRDISDLKPDAVLCGGDLVVVRRVIEQHTDWYQNTIKLFKALSPFPVYVVDGNHEWELTNHREGRAERRRGKDKVATYGILWGIIVSFGAQNLNNKSLHIHNVKIHGLKPSKELYLKNLTVKEINSRIGRADKGFFNVLIAHNPSDFEIYKEWGADLILSGHYHGGVIRVFNRGLLGPGFELLPPYTQGIYEKDEARMILYNKS
jgi:hypothetical protein